MKILKYIPLILVILFLLGVSYYKFFVYDKRNIAPEIIDVNDEMTQKYYNYVKANNYNEWVFIDKENYYDVNAINNNKILFGYLLALSEEHIDFIYGDVNKECEKIVKEIRERYEDMYVCGRACANGCYTEETKEEYWENNNDKLTYEIDEDKIKDSVELIYGKGTYTQSDFNILNSSIKMIYLSEEKVYVLITIAKGETIRNEISVNSSILEKAEKINKQLYLYENITFLTSENGDGVNIGVKHTFNKNKYDSNYHYVKSEIVSKENTHIDIEIIEEETEEEED